MDYISLVITTLVGIIASITTAYLTTKFKFKQEIKNWNKNFGLKYAEAKAASDDHASFMAAQYAIGYLRIFRKGESESEKVFIPANCNLVAGRGDHDDIKLGPDRTISRKHLFFKAGTKDVMIDVIGTNGAKIIRNNQKFEKINRSINLKDEDKILVGSTLIIYRKI